MLTEILGVLEKTNTRPVLTAFVILSLMIKATDGGLMSNPVSWEMALLLVFGPMAYAMVFYWIIGVTRLNSSLPENDVVSYGPMLGSSLLAVCLIFAFSYLANHPEGLSFSLLGQPNFIYFCTLLLLSAETTKIRRH